MPTFTSKLLALGLTTALGGAGAILGGPAATSLIEQPAPPSSFTIGQAPALEASAELDAPLLPAGIEAATLADPRVAAALRDPMVRSVLADPAVRVAIADIDPAVLGRPGVLESIRRGEIDPSLAADPVVLANLPEIMSAIPVIRAAARRAEATIAATEDGAAAEASPDGELELDEACDDEGCEDRFAARARAHAARDARHAARDARHLARDARHEARRAILRDGRPAPGTAPRGLTASQRAELRALAPAPADR